MFAYVGSIQNLKDLNGPRNATRALSPNLECFTRPLYHTLFKSLPKSLEMLPWQNAGVLTSGSQVEEGDGAQGFQSTPSLERLAKESVPAAAHLQRFSWLRLVS